MLSQTALPCKVEKATATACPIQRNLYMHTYVHLAKYAVRLCAFPASAFRKIDCNYFNVKKAFAKTSTAVAAGMSLSFMFETLGLRPPTGLK